MNQKDIERLQDLASEVNRLQGIPEAYRGCVKALDRPKASLCFEVYSDLPNGPYRINVPVAEFRDLITPILMRLAGEAEAKLAELESPWADKLHWNKLPR